MQASVSRPSVVRQTLLPGGGLWTVQFDVEAESLFFGPGSDFCIIEQTQIAWGQNTWTFDEEADAYRSYVDSGDGYWVNEHGGDCNIRAGDFGSKL